MKEYKEHMKPYLLLFSLLLFFSCKKEEPIEVIDNSWELFSEIAYQSKNASNCFVYNDKMIVRSLNSLSYIDKNHNLMNRYLMFSNLAYGYKQFPTNSGYNVTLSEGLYPSRIECRPLMDLTGSISFDFEQDSALLGLEKQLSIYEPVYLSSPTGKFLFKVKENVTQKNTGLVLADILTPKNYQKIRLNSLPNNTSLNLYSSGRFYFSTSGVDPGFFTVDTMGNVEKISSQGYPIVAESNGVFFAVGAFFDLSISFDQGQTWNQTTIKAPSGNIINLNNQTFILNEDHIIQVIIEYDNIQLLKYNSKGLEGNTITALCNFNGRYYCSTKSGVFYLQEENFKPEN